MVGIPIVKIVIRYLSHSQFLHLLWQYRHPMNRVIPSSAHLTCFATENILLPPHLKQVYNGFSRASCSFSSCFITRFTFSLTESKIGCSKIGFMFVSTFFSLYLKINMDKTSQKVTKDQDPKCAEAGRKGRENFMKKMNENILNDAKKRWRRYYQFKQ